MIRAEVTEKILSQKRLKRPPGKAIVAEIGGGSQAAARRRRHCSAK